MAIDLNRSHRDGREVLDFELLETRRGETKRIAVSLQRPPDTQAWRGAVLPGRPQEHRNRSQSRQHANSKYRPRRSGERPWT